MSAPAFTAALDMPDRLAFSAPPPGLAPLVDFSLAIVDATPGLYSLSAGSVRLFLLDAAIYLPDYAPAITGGQYAALGLERGAGVLLEVVNPAGQTTVNLAAPILANPATGACTQLILEGDHPLRAPLNPN
jgi:flagellar assembly factor FliW